MKYKQVEDIKDLNIGDIIRGNLSGLAYVFTSNYSTRVTAVRTIDVTNAIEWQVLVDDEKEPESPTQC